MFEKQGTSASPRMTDPTVLHLTRAVAIAAGAGKAAQAAQAGKAAQAAQAAKMSKTCIGYRK